MAKLLLIIAICSIVYSDNWRKFYSIFRKLDFTVPVFINFTFFSLAVFSIITYAQCYKRVQPVLVLPMLTHLVRIFLSLYRHIFEIMKKNGEKWPKNGFKNSLEPFQLKCCALRHLLSKNERDFLIFRDEITNQEQLTAKLLKGPETIELLMEKTTHKTMFE